MFGIGSHMPIRKTYWYSTSDSKTRYELIGSERPLSDVAVDAVDDYHGQHDGWESIWPLDFLIYETEEGQRWLDLRLSVRLCPSFLHGSGNYHRPSTR